MRAVKLLFLILVILILQCLSFGEILNLTTIVKKTCYYSRDNLTLYINTDQSGCTPPFPDVPCDHWAVSNIQWIKDRGITKGYPDGTFRPEWAVKRSEMAAFIIRALEGEPADGSYSPNPYFSDVPPTHWAFRYVQRIRERGIASGYTGTTLYGPEDTVTREQMAKMLIMALDSQGRTTEPPSDYCSTGVPFTDVNAGMWSCRYIKRLKELGITTGYGDGRYGPEDPVTRAQMATFLYRTFGKAEIYYTTMGVFPRFIMEINQSGNSINFRLSGAGRVIEGVGTISNGKASLSANINGIGEFTSTIYFSDDRKTFFGTWEISGNIRLGPGTITGDKNLWEVYDVDQYGIPQFVVSDFTELEKTSKISKFRSGIGHDFSDDFESCRSMKHYYYPNDISTISTIKIFSPVNGTVNGMVDEWDGTLWKGTTISIEPDDYKAFNVIIYHVNLTNQLTVGSKLKAGQYLGTSAKSSGTFSDIAVGLNTPRGYKLVSFFQVMTDSVFQNYQARNLTYRDSAIISKEARDGDPLICQGETFINEGTIENWIYLK